MKHTSLTAVSPSNSKWTSSAVLSLCRADQLAKSLYHDSICCSISSCVHIHVLSSMQQQAGAGWAPDQTHGERSTAQQEARGAQQAGLVSDPKEDANRVIEDILAVSHL